jgi:hypothetical protein
MLFSFSYTMFYIAWIKQSFNIIYAYYPLNIIIYKNNGRSVLIPFMLIIH